MTALFALLARSGTVVLATTIGITFLCLSTSSSGPHVLGVSGHRMPYAVYLHERGVVNKQQQIQDVEQEQPTCTTVEVLLTHENLKANQWLENNGIPAPGVRFGGSIPIMDPQTQDDMGQYTYLLTFLPNNDCVATGSYTFTTSNTQEEASSSSLPGPQITFTATCKALPYFTITGGAGTYHGATGHVQYQIPDGTRGYRHAIHVCA